MRISLERNDGMARSPAAFFNEERDGCVQNIKEKGRFCLLVDGGTSCRPLVLWGTKIVVKLITLYFVILTSEEELSLCRDSCLNFKPSECNSTQVIFSFFFVCFGRTFFFLVK
jgi:hypothetical protein